MAVASLHLSVVVTACRYMLDGPSSAGTEIIDLLGDQLASLSGLRALPGIEPGNSPGVLAIQRSPGLVFLGAMKLCA